MFQILLKDGTYIKNYHDDGDFLSARWSTTHKKQDAGAFDKKTAMTAFHYIKSMATCDWNLIEPKELIRIIG